MPYNFRQRPLAIGLQISRTCSTQNALGTTGCFVRSSRKDLPAYPVYLLTAGHVLDPTLKPTGPMTPTSDQIHQPDDGSDAIATMRWNAVHYGTVRVADAWMGIDAGVVQLNTNVTFKNYAWRIGDITGIAEPQVDQLVMKHGRTTGLTYGVITRIDANADTNPSSPLVNMIEVAHRSPTQLGLEGDAGNSFCDEGDSGAALINERREIVGIIHARSGIGDGAGLATRASAIFQYMQLQLA